MLKNLSYVFQTLGLNAHESRVLLILLKYSNQRVKNIAISAKLNRTTTYGILKSLMGKGLVSLSKTKGVTEFQSIEPGLLLDYIERKQKNLRDAKEKIVDVLPYIENVRKQKRTFPHIRFFEGIEGVKQAYEDTLENNEEKKLLDFTGTDAVFKIMGKEWVDYYVKKRARLGIQCFDIAPDTEWSRLSQKMDKELLRITKLIPEKYTFNTEIDVYDHKIAFFSFSEEQPIAVIIEDIHIAQTMKMLFEYINTTI